MSLGANIVPSSTSALPIPNSVTILGLGVGILVTLGWYVYIYSGLNFRIERARMFRYGTGILWFCVVMLAAGIVIEENLVPIVGKNAVEVIYAPLLEELGKLGVVLLIYVLIRRPALGLRKLE